MVRATCGVATGGVATGGGAAASRLHLSVLGPTGAPVIKLRVDKAEWWTLENITVLQSPDGSLVGAFFQHVNAAMGQLKKFLPHSNAANYIELLQVYVVGARDEAVLGKRDIRFKLYGESVSTRHSPELLTAPVRCLEAAPLEGGGRWLPVAVLRPFAPAHLPDAECTSRMAELMRQVRVGRRGREARAHCCFWSCLTALWPLRVSLPHRINTSHSCARSFAARPQRRPKPSPARSARCPQASRQSPS